jgi:hypothetical protein
MSSSLKLQQASGLLLAALQLAQAERDRALFELARGQRSQRELQRLSERVALLANLLLQLFRCNQLSGTSVPQLLLL